MPAGRPRKTREDKKLSGTLQPCRDNKDRPVVDIVMDAGPPPDMLSSSAKEVWAWVVPLLIEPGIYTKMDEITICAFCEEYALYWEFKELTRNKYRIVKGKKELKKDELKEMHNAYIRWSKIAMEFGFTPVSRDKIKVKKPKKGDGILDRLLK